MQRFIRSPRALTQKLLCVGTSVPPKRHSSGGGKRNNGGNSKGYGTGVASGFGLVCLGVSLLVVDQKGTKEGSSHLIANTASASSREEESRGEKLGPSVVVVGGGIVGASLALQLKRQRPDVQVTVLEQGTIGGGASGLSAGTIHVDGWGSFNDINTCLSMGTMAILKQLQQQGYDCELIQRGALDIVVSPDALKFFKSTHSAKDKTYHSKWLSPEEVARVVPGLTGVLGGELTPLSGHVNPLLTTVALAEAAADLGARVVEHEKVVGVERIQGEAGGLSYNVSTQSGKTYKANHVVFAAGVGLRELGAMIGLHIPISPVKGIIWSTDPLEHKPFGDLCIFTHESYAYWNKHSDRNDALGIPEFCSVNDECGVTVKHAYGRQTADGSVIFGGGRVPLTMFSASDSLPRTLDDVEQQTRNNVVSFAKTFWPEMSNVGMQGFWEGVMPFSQDGKLFVGELDELGWENIWVLGGFGPSGIRRGPMAASLTAFAMSKRIDQNLNTVCTDRDRNTEQSEVGQCTDSDSLVCEGLGKGNSNPRACAQYLWRLMCEANPVTRPVGGISKLTGPA